MTNDTMPKRITMARLNPNSLENTVISDPLPTDAKVIKADYVRADLVQGDPDEPLAVGQTRWVRMYQGDPWRAAEIGRTGVHNRLCYTICGEDLMEYVDDCYEWGSVIQPPENA